MSDTQRFTRTGTKSRTLVNSRHPIIPLSGTTPKILVRSLEILFFWLDQDWPFDMRTDGRGFDASEGTERRKRDSTLGHQNGIRSSRARFYGLNFNTYHCPFSAANSHNSLPSTGVTKCNIAHCCIACE
jgi:hypothetical protein